MARINDPEILKALKDGRTIVIRGQEHGFKIASPFDGLVRSDWDTDQPYYFMLSDLERDDWEIKKQE